MMITNIKLHYNICVQNCLKLTRNFDKRFLEFELFKKKFFIKIKQQQNCIVKHYKIFFVFGSMPIKHKNEEK